VEGVTFIVISMVVIVAVAGLVVAFTAFPHRGEEMPGVPWLGEAMDRASGAMPTLEHDEAGETRTLAGLRDD
jgi:hypothetical protein